MEIFILKKQWRQKPKPIRTMALDEGSVTWQTGEVALQLPTQYSVKMKQWHNRFHHTPPNATLPTPTLPRVYPRPPQPWRVLPHEPMASSDSASEASALLGPRFRSPFIFPDLNLRKTIWQFLQRWQFTSWEWLGNVVTEIYGMI